MTGVFMNEQKKKKDSIRYFDVAHGSAPMELGECLLRHLQDVHLENYTPIILCIGTDRATGDCLGPLVGEKLMHYHEDFQVIGNLSAPVHALNLCDALHDIRYNYENPFVIAVDASLGSSAHVGLVTLTNGPIFPGKGVRKKLPAIGDISITGIVNVSGGHPGLLQSTRLYTVMQLADCIAEALNYSLRYYLDNF